MIQKFFFSFKISSRPFCCLEQVSADSSPTTLSNTFRKYTRSNHATLLTSSFVSKSGFGLKNRQNEKCSTLYKTKFHDFFAM